MSMRRYASALLMACLAVAVVTAQAQETYASQMAADGDAGSLFTEAATREAVLRRELATMRPGNSAASARRVRTLVGAYEDLARLFPTSGQADKALWQGAALSADLFW